MPFLPNDHHIAMKKYQFKCLLLSDVVLTSVAATEGFHESLDYIPGAKFLGIVAGAQYEDLLGTNKQAVLDLFHNGTVRFSDALPFVDGEKALRVPLSWQKAKGSDDGMIYLHHKLTKDVRQKLQEEGKHQLKQERGGYFTPASNKRLTFDQAFSLKSAYDKDLRKSEDGKMFGYFALRAGTEWVFDVEDDSGQYMDKIRSILEGKHRIGRSKSAEYGLIDITPLGNVPEASVSIADTSLLIYAESNLCFYDACGRTTAQPTAQQLTGLQDAAIDWKNSQVRSRNYQTWNTKRDNKDADRIIIERGSVFCITLPDDQMPDPDFYKRGIGAHRAEGFGKVLINPSFLTSDTQQYSKHETKAKPKLHADGTITPNDAEILEAIRQRYQRSQFPSELEKQVQAFIRQYKPVFDGLSNSQWGTLRNYAKGLPNYEAFHTMVFHTDNGFMYRGVSEKEWKKKERRELLEEFVKDLPKDSRLPFLVRLCNQMPKPKQRTDELSN